MIYKLGEEMPIIGEDTFISNSSDIIGKVEIKKGVSIWFGAVLRGDVEKIIVNENSNIQDNCTIHTDFGFPCVIGKNVSVEHNVILHGCKVGNNTIIGMGSTILNGAEIGNNCMVGANSLVTKSLPVEEGVLIMGSPSRIIRKLTEEEINSLRKNAEHYRENSKKYRLELKEVEKYNKVV